MEHLNPILIKNKIIEYIDKIGNIEGISDNCKQNLSKMKDEIISVVKKRYKSLESIEKYYKDSSDSFNKEYRTQFNEYHDIKSFTYDFTHLAAYLEILIAFYQDFHSEEILQTYKTHIIEKGILLTMSDDNMIKQ